MKKLKTRNILFVVTLTILALPIVKVAVMSPTKLYLDPPEIGPLSVDDIFTLTLKVDTLSDLYLWIVTIEWNSSRLELQGNPVEGNCLKSGGTTTFLWAEITPGEIRELTCTLLGPVPGISVPPAPDDLATINFKVLDNTTDTWVNITFSDLLDSTGSPIQHSTQGTRIVGARTHDVALLTLIPSKTVVGTGFNINISVAIENQGDFTENFNVTAYADLNATIIGDENTIGIQNITLSSGNSTLITFTWNTTGVSYGNYTISAYATPVPGETDTTDNTYVDCWVIVTISGDVNGDGIVDASDLFNLGKAYRSTPESPNWNPNCDFNDDNKVDASDLFELSKNYGKTC